MEIDKKTIIFDFDGVLCIPGSINFYPYVPYIIEKLYSKGYNLCIATFNNNAELIVHKWGCEKYFKEIRAGSNTKNKGLYLNNGVLRSLQMFDIINSLNLVGEIYLYDCDINVLREVASKYHDINMFYLNNNYKDFLNNIEEI